MRKYLFILLIFCLGCESFLFAANLQQWKDEILYFVLLDRFHNGNQANDYRVDLDDPHGFHGGDIRGLVDKLEYLDKLGITGLWISPIFENRRKKFFDHSAYHGYWVYDFWKTDDRFADEHELELLKKYLKKHKMKLLLDMVVNHMGYDAPFVKRNPRWFNNKGNIKNWNDKNQLINYNIFGLPDFASHKPVVKTFFELVGRHWIDKMQPDGFRLDAVKHVPVEFWDDFNTMMAKAGGRNFLLLGEHLNGNPASLNEIWRQGSFSTLFDYPLYYSIKEVFAEKKDCRKLASRLYFDRNYPDAGLLATFVDNHDLDRFYSLCRENQKRYLLSMAFLMTVRGIPVLCYGDEIGLAGFQKPDEQNRSDMIFDRPNKVFYAVKNLIKLRKEHVALRRGLQCHLYADKNILAFARLTPDNIAVAVFNNGALATEVDFPFPFKLYKSSLLKDELSGVTGMVQRQRFKTFLPPETAAVFVPESPPEFYRDSFRSWQKRQSDEKAWGTVKVNFKLKVDYAPPDSRFFLTGNCPELGNWDAPARALQMNRVADDEFEVQVELPVGKVIECKSLYRRQNEENEENEEAVKTVWQQGENTIFTVRKAGSEYVHLNWKFLK
ncbi:MAG: alpha-amylase family glycosyl hydrolase [Candidatus Rifleibacteriota bacterium]